MRSISARMAGLAPNLFSREMSSAALMRRTSSSRRLLSSACRSVSTIRSKSGGFSM